MHWLLRVESDGNIINFEYVKPAKLFGGHFFSLPQRNAHRKTLILTGHIRSITAALICPQIVIEISSVRICSHLVNRFSSSSSVMFAFSQTFPLPWIWRHYVPSKHLHGMFTHNATVRIVVEYPVAQICCCKWHRWNLDAGGRGSRYWNDRLSALRCARILTYGMSSRASNPWHMTYEAVVRTGTVEGDPGIMMWAHQI